ncbi:MAG: ABC transporter permease, partial [bacterium]|nr:ABC transporter permease [bacterium]
MNAPAARGALDGNAAENRETPRIRDARLWHQLRAVAKHPSGRFGLLLIAPVLILAIAGPLVIDWDPIKINPSDTLQGPSARHWFGTDQLGRDLAARVVSAIPVVIWVPLGAV